MSGEGSEGRRQWGGWMWIKYDNKTRGQCGSVQQELGGRGIILGVADRSWVTEGWDGGAVSIPLNVWSVCGSVGVCS